MSNYELPSDEVDTIAILTQNAAGTSEPFPSNDTPTVVSSSPSLGVAIGTTATGAPAVVLTPMVQASPGITVTVSDSAGLTAFVLTVDIVQDVTPTNLILDVANATHVSQPEPTAPGP